MIISNGDARSRRTGHLVADSSRRCRSEACTAGHHKPERNGMLRTGPARLVGRIEAPARLASAAASAQACPAPLSREDRCGRAAALGVEGQSNAAGRDRQPEAAQSPVLETHPGKAAHGASRIASRRRAFCADGSAPPARASGQARKSTLAGLARIVISSPAAGFRLVRAPELRRVDHRGCLLPRRRSVSCIGNPLVREADIANSVGASAAPACGAGLQAFVRGSRLSGRTAYAVRRWVYGFRSRSACGVALALGWVQAPRAVAGPFYGRGMWIWHGQPQRGRESTAIAAQASANGIKTLFIKQRRWRQLLVAVQPPAGALRSIPPA